LHDGMVNFNDPTVIEEDALAVSLLWHTVSGVYIWEYFTTLEYEWSVIRGRRPYLRTIWIYSLARFFALLTIVLEFVIANITIPLNCQAAISSVSAFVLLTMSASSLLIVLRIIAIWNRNRVVMTIAIIIWGITAVVYVQFIARLRWTQVPGQLGCVQVNLKSTLINLISVPFTDIALLLIMLIGVFRLRGHGSSMFGMTKVLWTQGVFWLLLAIAAEIPAVVFILLDLNASFDVMFELPTWVTMVIAASRLHRSLVDLASGSTDVFSSHGNFLTTRDPVQEPKGINAASVPMNVMEVAVHIVSERHRTLRMRNDDSCGTSGALK